MKVPMGSLKWTGGSMRPVWLATALLLAAAEPSMGQDTAPDQPVLPRAQGTVPTTSSSDGWLPAPVGVPLPDERATDKLDPMDRAYGAFQRGWYLSAAILAKPLAEAGNTKAQTLLGVMLEAGLGMEKKPKEAARWYEEAAKAGDIPASQQLAQLYLLGNGVPQDKGKAADLLEKAASKEDAAALYNLALIYQEGKGRPQNGEKAFELLRDAAYGNYPQAQYSLAMSYMQTVEEDPANADANTLGQAAFWMGRAARRGHTEAQLYYGILRFQGRGVEPDEAEGADWFERAATAGNAIAMNRLARCYAAGRGRPQDPVLAIKWHYIARSLGVEDEALDTLAGQLDEGTRSSAQDLAEGFIGKPIALARNQDE